MSSTRNRNKLCVSLDSSSRNTSSNTVHLNRWSEVVPPKSALTFAALWDPEDGMVTFSGAALLESESLSDMLDIFDDDHSQLASADRDSDEDTATSEDTATLATFQDAFKAFLHRKPLESKEHLCSKAGHGTPSCLQSCASSTFDGLDVYSHDIQIKPKRLPCVDLLDVESSLRTPSVSGRLRLQSDLMLDSYCPESEESGSSSGSRPSYLRSRFSTTTTSTSNYVDVTASALQSTRTSEIPPIPESHNNEGVPLSNSWPSLPHRRRLLRKRRPSDNHNATQSATSSMPSTPRKISPGSFIPPFPSPSSTVTASSSSAARGTELHGRFPRPIGSLPTSTSTPPSTPSKKPRLKLSFALLPGRKRRQTSSDSEGWVCIDFTPIIRQRYVADLDDD